MYNCVIYYYKTNAWIWKLVQFSPLIRNCNIWSRRFQGPELKTGFLYIYCILPFVSVLTFFPVFSVLGSTTPHSFNQYKVLNKLKYNVELLLLKFCYIITCLNRNSIITKKKKNKKIRIKKNSTKDVFNSKIK